MKIPYKKGVTLIEALFVLGIMAILIGMVMILYSQSTEKEKNNDFLTEILDINHIIQTLYKDQSDYSGLSADTIIKSGLLNSKYINGNQITSPFGTPINFSAWQDSSNHWFPQFVLTDVPRSACIHIVSYDFTGIADDLSPNGFQGTQYQAYQYALECNKGDNEILINFNK